MIRNYRIPLWSAALIGLLAMPVGALAQQKTVKQCNEEWTANKASIQASGKKKSDFVAECRAGQTSAAPAAAATAPKAPAPPAATAPPPAAAAPPPSAGSKQATTTTPRTAAGMPAGAGQFTTEAQAKSHCPGDTVVWANLDSKVYHFSGNKSYGNTKSGAYMCEKDTTATGMRAAKNEKHP
jgi:hypothetical protein